MTQERKPVITPDQVGVVTRLVNTLRLVWRLLNDTRVPGLPKLLVPAALIYVLFPVDIVPDFILGLGQLDDLGVVMLAVTAFIQLCPRAVVDEHRRVLASGASTNPAADENVIDGTYREVRDDDSK